MWVIALLGFCSKILFVHRIDGVAVWTYVALGWMPILPANSLIEVVPAAALWWMLVGGLFYTAGTVFLVSDIKRFHFHGIWHTCVIAGSACHFFAILYFVAR
jgi:hemolysin III